MVSVNWNQLKERYVQQEISLRLGGIATNLSRLHSLTLTDANEAIAAHLVRESQFLIEWTAADTDIELAAELVELQRLLS